MSLAETNRGILAASERDLRRSRIALAVALAAWTAVSAWWITDPASPVALAALALGGPALVVVGCVHGPNRSAVRFDRWHVARDHDPNAPKPSALTLRAPAPPPKVRHVFTFGAVLVEPGISDVDGGRWSRCTATCAHCPDMRSVWIGQTPEQVAAAVGRECPGPRR